MVLFRKSSDDIHGENDSSGKLPQNLAIGGPPVPPSPQTFLGNARVKLPDLTTIAREVSKNCNPFQTAKLMPAKKTEKAI